MLKKIDAHQLKEMVDQKDRSILLIDVRENAEFSVAHLEHAIHLPLSTLPKVSLPDFTGKDIVFYCRSGYRSEIAAEYILQQPDVRVVYNLRGGLLKWIQAQYPIIRPTHS